MPTHPAFLNAGNASPFTLDGTRTFRVGERDTVLLDPGPDVERHVRALVDWVAGAERVQILLTHGHSDHAAAAPRLARMLDAPVLGPTGVAAVDTPLEDGARIDTDAGALVAVSTPGHAEPHYAYHWTECDGLFVGDLFLGEGDTTWVGEYPGCVADYLASLERVRLLAPGVLFPAHGPFIEDVPAVLDRYERHRRDRIRQVEQVVAEQPDIDAEGLLDVVYGPALPSAFAEAARLSLEALLVHVRSGPVA